jgi:hypothetical protein
MDKIKNHPKPLWLFLAVIIVGIAARLLAATRGHNYDMDSSLIVADIMNHGGNVYASTPRYNYGPVWFNILHVLDLLARHNQTVFRYLVPGFLSLVDVGIFFILWRKFGKLAASFFFLNPVTVIITGYHSQFDNLALLLGLLAVLLMGDEFDQPLNRRKVLGLLVLGISLATKHVLFAFPLWLAIKQKGMLQKLVILLLPIAVFALGLLPYWPGGKHGIIQNVLLYRSLDNGYFYHYLVPMGVQTMFNSQTIWGFVLVIFAFVFRQRNALESLLLYTCVLVAASPAIVNQYLAIPMPFVATHLNLFTILYAAVASLHLLVDANGLHLTIWTFRKCDDVAICILCLALIWVTWGQPIKALLEKCIFEVKNQFNGKK